MRYCPEPSVTAVRTFSMMAGLDASTVTPGSTAPDVSFTTPVIEAWANAVAGAIRRPANTTQILANRRIVSSKTRFDPALTAQYCTGRRARRNPFGV